jgi:arsenite-transporting ATPase
LCVIFKGGVGKTTTSALLAIAMANAAHKVALVSTDPAHSVGDANQIDLTGDKLIDVPLFGLVGLVKGLCQQWK